MNYHTKYLKYKNKYLNLKNKIGGTNICEAEGFNQKLREATLGTAYPHAVVDHDKGERDTYEKLVDISTRGMVGWYCKQANLTPEECKIITDMPEVQILGAFYHRYKVFIEHIDRTINIFLLDDKNIDNINPDDIFKKVKKDSLPKKQFNDDLKFVKSYLKKYSLENYEELIKIWVLLNKIVDKIQCLLWIIVKNKKLPDGFIMDERIISKAYKLIIFDEIYKNNNYIRYSSQLQSGQNRDIVIGINMIANLIKFLIEDYNILYKPQVTFNVDDLYLDLDLDLDLDL